MSKTAVVVYDNILESKKNLQNECRIQGALNNRNENISELCNKVIGKGENSLQRRGTDV